MEVGPGLMTYIKSTVRKQAKLASYMQADKSDLSLLLANLRT